VRRRAAELAEAMAGSGPGATTGMTPRVSTRVEATPTGVRILLVPIHPKDREAVRERIRRHELVMLEGDCSWMR
jgi:hypothetical protein